MIKKSYFQLKHYKCICCHGQGAIIICKCQSCGSYIGVCSESDVASYIITKESIIFKLREKDFYSCPVCSSRELPYATASEIECLTGAGMSFEEKNTF